MFVHAYYEYVLCVSVCLGGIAPAVGETCWPSGGGLGIGLGGGLGIGLGGG